MKNNAPKSPADEFEVGKAAPVAAKAEASTLPAPAKKPFGPIGLPAPVIPKDIGGGVPAQHKGKPVVFDEKLPDDLGVLFALLTTLDNEQEIKGDRRAELMRQAKLKAVRAKVHSLQQIAPPPRMDADNLRIGPSHKRLQAMADTLR